MIGMSFIEIQYKVVLNTVSKLKTFGQSICDIGCYLQFHVLIGKNTEHYPLKEFGDTVVDDTVGAEN